MVIFFLCERRIVDGALKAAAPLLFFFLHDVELFLKGRHTYQIDTQLLSKLLAELESKLAIVAVSWTTTATEYKLKLVGMLVTLLHVLTTPDVFDPDATREDDDLNMPIVTSICKILLRTCDHECHSAAIKTLVYSSLPVVCHTSPGTNSTMLQMLMSRIDAFNSFGVEFVHPQLVVFSPSDLEMSACVQLVTQGSETTAVLVEPVDVLLQSLEICLRSHDSTWPPTPSNSINYLAPTKINNDAQLRAIRAVDAIVRVYLNNSSSSNSNEIVTRLVDQHLLQLEHKCRSHRINGVPLTAEGLLRARVQCLQIAYQLELGIVEALVEHTLMRETPTKDTYANVSLLLTRHEAIRSLFSVRLEELRREQEQFLERAQNVNKK